MPSPGLSAAQPRTAPRLDPGQVRALSALVAAAEEEDGVPPLSDHVMLHLGAGGDARVVHLLVDGADGELAGYAHLDTTDPVEGPSAELVVAPAARGRGIGGALVRAVDVAARASAPNTPLRLWSHGASPAAAALATGGGFRQARVLHQMRRPLRPPAPPLPPVRWPEGVSVRTFEVGRDEPAWTEVNNRAFADHPDQGGWSVAEVALRESEDWFEAAGFFLAERTAPSGQELVGFHWTKVHGEAHQDPSHGHEALGEVYVVGVDPSAQGTGLGLALTVHGLAHLQARGLEQAMLYVDESNTAAVRLYERLGFHRHLTDVSYRRD